MMKFKSQCIWSQNCIYIFLTIQCLHYIENNQSVCQLVILFSAFFRTHPQTMRDRFSNNKNVQHRGKPSNQQLHHLNGKQIKLKVSLNFAFDVP